MIYAAIMAGGVGNRMGGEMPKQYMDVAGVPVIIHSVKTFAACDEIDHILVLCPADWLDYTRKLIKKHLSPCTDGRAKDRPVTVIAGGKTRDDTLTCALDYIEAQGHMTEDTVIVTHDAARPLVTERIIKENVSAALKYGACNTVIPSTDTIVESTDGQSISRVPDRRTTYQCQTPQTFNALTLKRIHDSLTEEEKAHLTDASKIFVLRDHPVRLVMGEASNLKITYPRDIEAAEYFLRQKEPGAQTDAEEQRHAND